MGIDLALQQPILIFLLFLFRSNTLFQKLDDIFRHFIDAASDVSQFRAPFNGWIL